MRAREEIQQKSDLGKSTRKKRKITYGREREREIRRVKKLRAMEGSREST